MQADKKIKKDNQKRTLSTFARVRPFLPHECGSEQSVFVDEDGKAISLKDNSKPRFARRFKINTLNDVDQEKVFAEVLPMLEYAFEGINTSIFCYGQTGTGKTLTMLGNDLWDMANSYKQNYLSLTSPELRKANSLGSPRQISVMVHHHNHHQHHLLRIKVHHQKSFYSVH